MLLYYDITVIMTSQHSNHKTKRVERGSSRSGAALLFFLIWPAGGARALEVCVSVLGSMTSLVLRLEVSCVFWGGLVVRFSGFTPLKL